MNKHPFYPRSPYAVAKLYAYWITINYREAYNIFASNGILFNHESPIRGETFVTRKITRAISRIFYGIQDMLFVGNLDAKRDWGHAKDYVKMMWLILQHNQAEDWVISTGKTTSVRDFIVMCLDFIGIEIDFKGKGTDEIGIVKKVNNSKSKMYEGQIIINVDKRYYRPTEVDLLIGDSKKAKKILGWEPEYSVKSLSHEMMRNDLMIAEKEILNNSI